MHIPIISAANPGPFEWQSAQDYTPAIVLGVLGLICLVVLLGITQTVRDDRDRVHPKAVAARIFYGSLAGTVLFFFAMLGAGVLITTSEVDSKEAARLTYAESVASWLDDEYGVEVSTDSATGLIGGETLVVVYKGAKTMAEIIDGADGDLSVRVPDGALLKPLTR